MRIATIVTTLGLGGAERQALEIARHMAARDHAVMMLALGKAAGEEWPASLEVVRLGFAKTPWGLVAGLLRARHALRQFCPDVLHSHCFHSNMVARVLREIGVPGRIVNTVHNVYEGGWRRNMAYRLTDALADRVTAVCRAAADRYVLERMVARHKMQVVVNGIDTAAFCPCEEQRKAMRQAMQVGTEFVWLSAGRLALAKDPANLLRAFVRVRTARHDAQLWVAGGGNRSCMLEMQKLAAELGLGGSVRWLGVRRDLKALYDAADGFVLGSAWEGMPLAIGEAMAMEKPVAATDVGGVRELTGEYGVLAPARDSDALADKLLAVMAMPEAERKRVGALGRRRIVESFSMAERVDEWEALYRTVTQTRAGEC